MIRRTFLAAAAMLGVVIGHISPAAAASKEIVYITPALDIPFWRLVSKGINASATKNGYTYTVLESRNNAATQLKNAQDAISRDVAAIVLTPTDSATAGSVLALAKRAGIPVSIADIGADTGEYVSYVHSDNYAGGKGVGEALAAALKKRGWNDGRFAIISISLARKIGQERTNGFRDAMNAAGFKDEAPLKQMQSYTMDETLKYSQDTITANPNLRGLFIELDQVSLAGLQAIKAAGKQEDVLLAAFDGNLPLYVDLLKSKQFTALGLQTPYVLGFKAADALFTSLSGGKPEKEIVLPMIIATPENLESLMPQITKDVLAEGL